MELVLMQRTGLSNDELKLKQQLPLSITVKNVIDLDNYFVILIVEKKQFSTFFQY